MGVGFRCYLSPSTEEDPLQLFLSGNVGGRFRKWPLERLPIVIGRSSQSAVQISDSTVSKSHAEITATDGRLHVRDLGSRNGTRVNGVLVEKPMEIRSGDHLEIGHVRLEVTSDVGDVPVLRTSDVDTNSSVMFRAPEFLKRETGKHISLATSAGLLRGEDPTAGVRTAAETDQILHVLAEAGQLLVLPRPLRETCDEILRIVDKAVPSTRLILLLQERPDQPPRQVAARYRGGSAREALVLSQKIMDLVLKESNSVLTKDASVDPRFQHQVSIVSQSVHSAMAVPLFDNERVLGLLYADTNHPAVAYNNGHLEVLTLVANMAAVKITNARLLEAEQARLRIAEELATAVRIQRGLLPQELPRIPGYRIHAVLQTCHEVGGDLYDFHVAADGSVCFLVADVSGKGMGAALLMSSFLSSARVLFDLFVEPHEIMARLNEILHRGTNPEHFVTAFLGKLRPETNRLEFVNAGHPPPYVLSSGAFRELGATGIPVGMLPGVRYTTETVEMEPRALLAAFSDGITEARHGNEMFEEDRLKEVLAEIASREDLDAASAEILKRVDAFAGDEPRADDITLVLLRRAGEA